jgi:hypothetical protein
LRIKLSMAEPNVLAHRCPAVDPYQGVVEGGPAKAMDAGPRKWRRGLAEVAPPHQPAGLILDEGFDSSP